jgi:hypothetical protein
MGEEGRGGGKAAAVAAALWRRGAYFEPPVNEFKTQSGCGETAG